MILLNCAINSTAPYQPDPDRPWNARRVAHLYKRLGFGASRSEIEAGLNMTPSQLVDQLLDTAASLPAPSPPYWANYTMADYADDDDLIGQHQTELAQNWLRDMATEGVRAKFALFWHNHFVTELRVYDCNAYLWSYYLLLHQYGMGNFRTFVEEMGKTPAMLSYLNGNENVVDEPNENYARELLELFTLGESNGYSQDDIVEVARALTGWRADDYECTPAFFDPDYFDNGDKTIFGQTGNWNYEDVHEMIFTLRKNELSQYICAEIYKAFVYDEPNEDIIAAMASTFQQNNFDLLPVFKLLFKSEHFFDESLLGAKIKSPFECMVGLTKVSDLQYPTDYDEDFMNYTLYACMDLGQDMFNPIDVAGWPGQRDWVNENTLTFRWSFTGSLLQFYFSDAARSKLVQLALDLSTTFNDAEEITRAVAEHFIPLDLPEAQIAIALQYFKGDIPENYFEDGSWSLYWSEAPDQLISLLGYLVRLPEYQLS